MKATKNRELSISVTGLALFLGFINTSEASLLGVSMQYPSVSLNDTYIIYNSTGVSNSTGLLSIVALGATLNSGPYPSPTLSQSYTSGEGNTPIADLMLTIAIKNGTGEWSPVTGSGINKVSIGFGNDVVANDPNTTTPGFSWTGDITGFGWLEGANQGKVFDATWQMTNDDYEDMPNTMGQFVDGILTSAFASNQYVGGINISNSAGFGSTNPNKVWQRDWIFGTDATKKAAQDILAPFIGGLANKACKQSDSTRCLTAVNSSVQADVFVPVPPAFWLWAGALASVIPSVRRIKR